MRGARIERAVGMKPYKVSFTGNDTFHKVIRLMAKDAMDAVVKANEIASKETIELFVRIDAMECVAR